MGGFGGASLTLADAVGFAHFGSRACVSQRVSRLIGKPGKTELTFLNRRDAAAIAREGQRVQALQFLFFRCQVCKVGANRNGGPARRGRQRSFSFLGVQCV